MKPKKISVRPGNELEGGGVVVWVYHRKVQIQLQFNNYEETVENFIHEAVIAWYFAMNELGEGL